MDGQAIVLFRDASRRACALLDACPHRKAPLSAGRVRPDGRLECPYHGWHFDGEGRGVAPSQPDLKRCDATALQVVERMGYLWIADRDVPASSFPQVSWDGFDYVGAFTTLFDAPLHVALDNFSEDEHTPWVHTRLGWDAKDAAAVEYEAENFNDHSAVKYSGRQRDTPARFLNGTRRGDLFTNSFVARFDPVRIEYTLSWTDPQTRRVRGATTLTLIFLVPETPRTTRFHVFVHIQLLDRALKLISPVVHKIVLGLVYLEIRDDAKFISLVADTPEDLKGMRLNKFDKPVIHNRRLLQRIYRGVEEVSVDTESTS